MNTPKTNSYARLIAFFLVAVTLICAFGFAANGWQSDTNNEPDSGEADNVNGETDENKDGSDDTDKTPEEPIAPEPKFYNPLTGLETNEHSSIKKPLAFVMNPLAPLYGISSADLAIEFPIEDGTTRLLSISQDTANLGKIGSLAPTRGYISNLAKYFGSVLVSTGSDDTVRYDSFDLSGSSFNLSENSGYHYTEYTHFVYTNGDLISAGLANSGISSVQLSSPTLPYKFVDIEDSPVKGETVAISVALTFSEASSTEFYYNSTENSYTLTKGGAEKKDLLNDKEVAFENLFILFADSITYEGKDASELVMNTSGSGEGYYVTGGTCMKILWSADVSGNMIFKTESGEILTVNRGASYIGFLKASRTDDVKFS